MVDRIAAVVSPVVPDCPLSAALLSRCCHRQMTRTLRVVAADDGYAFKGEVLVEGGRLSDD